ncbi:MAG: ArsR family transcriptional regulator [Marmoricola sp.]|jgi:predicted ArsR family transcriptional regulator|nr:ArsR family transcriptional regulator [Marmoricola sp.]
MPEDPSEPPTPQQVHDPRVLRAIAHPVRTRILDELSATGPMRAADIARTLGVPANQASFHLRQLAKYGLAAEAPEEARDGRDRVWKAAHEAGLSINTHELAEAPGGKAAVSVFRRQWSSAAHDAVSRAESPEHDPETLVMVSDTALRLTREQAAQLSDELTQLVDGWRHRGRSAGADARTYQLLQILQPAREV